MTPQITPAEPTRLAAFLAGGSGTRSAATMPVVSPPRRGRRLLSSAQIPSPGQAPAVVAPASPSVIYAAGGNWARVKLPGIRPPTRGDRRAISGFSDRSRRALLRSVNCWDRTRVQAGGVVFVTLTYPRDHPTARASKQDLERFLQAMGRRWGTRDDRGRRRLGVVWKLEPQKRGAPHYHLLAYCPGVDVAALTEWVATEWHRLAGGGDARHLAVHLGTAGGNSKPCVEVVRDWRGVASYAAKYLGKVDRTKGGGGWLHPGRYWGVRCRECLPVTLVTVELTAAAAVILRRACVRWYESQLSGWYYQRGRRLGVEAAVEMRLSIDLPGRRIHGSELVPVWPGCPAVPLARCWRNWALRTERVIRPQRRRWRAKRGGWSGFVSAATFERLLTWAIERGAVAGGSAPAGPAEWREPDRPPGPTNGAGSGACGVTTGAGRPCDPGGLWPHLAVEAGPSPECRRMAGLGPGQASWLPRGVRPRPGGT